MFRFNFSVRYLVKLFTKVINNKSEFNEILTVPGGRGFETPLAFIGEDLLTGVVFLTGETALAAGVFACGVLEGDTLVVGALFEAPGLVVAAPDFAAGISF